MAELAPITDHHFCLACDCRVPDERRYDALAARHSHLLTELRIARQALKECRRAARV